ncbi:thioesterase-like superfamily-domain-containing protein [Xylariales sp. PMI_506]|nr:thioesterase-like superfamily-domain-containing protein [Xylariales sp. PMI_506]
MAASAPVEDLSAVVRFGGSTPDVYTSKAPIWAPDKGQRAIFGGFLLAQSVAAAQATAPAGGPYYVHALQSTFLKAASATPSIEYHVERVADGRNFLTRLVRAVQAGVCVYVATVGLQRYGVSSDNALRYGGAPLPRALRDASPEDAGLSDSVTVLTEMGFPMAIKGLLMEPHEWRHLPRVWPPSPAGAGEDEGEDAATTRFRLHSFVRASAPFSDAAEPGKRPEQGSTPTDVAAHQAAMVFLSDSWFIYTANLASRDPRLRAGLAAIGLEASVSHNVWYHEPAGPGARADIWVACERETSWARDGRLLLHQKMWTWPEGRLVLSCTQEGALRLREGSSNGKVPNGPNL